MPDALPPVGHEYWTLNVSSPFASGSFHWIWMKWRVTAHRESLIVLHPPVSRMIFTADAVGRIEICPNYSYDRAEAIWKALGYF